MQPTRSLYVRHYFWLSKITFGRLQRRQDVEGTWATALPWWDVLPVVLVLRGLKNEMCVCSSEHFCCQVSAVPICSSHRVSWTGSRINQTAVAAEQGPVLGSRVAQCNKKSRPPMTLLKGCSCCVNWQR